MKRYYTKDYLDKISFEEFYKIIIEEYDELDGLLGFEGTFFPYTEVKKLKTALFELMDESEEYDDETQEQVEEWIKKLKEGKLEEGFYGYGEDFLFKTTATYDLHFRTKEEVVVKLLDDQEEDFKLLKEKQDLMALFNIALTYSLSPESEKYHESLDNDELAFFLAALSYSSFHQVTEEHINSVVHRLSPEHWNMLLTMQEFSTDFLDFHKERFSNENWTIITKRQKLTDDFIVRHIRMLGWDILRKEQDISLELALKLEVNLELLLKDGQNLSVESRTSIENYLQLRNMFE